MCGWCVVPGGLLPGLCGRFGACALRVGSVCVLCVWVLWLVCVGVFSVRVLLVVATVVGLSMLV